MRFALAALGLAVFGFAQTASASDVALAPVSFAPRFEVTVTNELGAREGDVLRAEVLRSVSEALAQRGATVSSSGPITIAISIIDAAPNRLTMLQLHHSPALDPGRSISLGGADLRAELRSANGEVVREVNYRRYDQSLFDFAPPRTTWSSADRAILQFAERVADAYVAETGAH